ncbi:MAG TPA: Na(+)/H(+) antiporter subunit C [Propionibacterium sp.]|jgi:multicomponent Na+:H+ antiporter subunit C|nr:Na(+)/H(+) antiporter subunit C [Propionibacterium sp.]
MSPSLTLAVLCGVLFGTGTVLLLSRALVRALLGVLLMGNGVNLMYMIASGRAGAAPLVDGTSNPPIGTGEMADPLPQAMVLTAIVITLAVTAFALALAHRAVQLQSTDAVGDDVESARTHERAVANDMSDSDYLDTADPYSVDEEHPSPDDDEEPRIPTTESEQAPEGAHVYRTDPTLPEDSPGGEPDGPRAGGDKDGRR